MAQNTSGVYAMLSHPRVYSVFQKLMGAHRGWLNFVNEFVRPEVGHTILDIGCGPGDILDYLPAVDYWGFDISDTYIKTAREKYGSRGKFYCKVLALSDLENMPKFDTVVASGVLHHMDDVVAEKFMELAYSALKPGGRLLTVDPCLTPRQNLIARFLILQDRGQNVRNREGYASLASLLFSKLHVEVRHKKWIPYTHCFMEGTRT